MAATMATMHNDDDNEYGELLPMLLVTKCQSVVVDQFGEFNVSSSRHCRVVLGIIERSVRGTRRSSAVHRCVIRSCRTPATTIRGNGPGCLAYMVARQDQSTDANLWRPGLKDLSQICYMKRYR